MNNITVIAAVIADTPCHFPPLFEVSHEWKLPYITKLNLLYVTIGALLELCNSTQYQIQSICFALT